jgi:integrase
MGTYLYRIEPYFGKKRLDEILPTDVKVWQSAMVKEGLSGVRINNIRLILNTILNDAVDDGILDENPLKKVTRIAKEDPDINPFTLQEVEQLLATANGWFRNMISVAFFTGFRTGELIALRWEDVDFDRDIIRIRQARRQSVTKSPKTKSSKRDITMLPRVKEALKAQFLLTGLKNKDVFLTQYGDGFQTSNTLTRRHWHPLCQKCGLEKRDFYHTRHTFATMMISHGEDILWVANTMGHKDISMVMKRYAKYRIDNSIKRATFLDKTVTSQLQKVAQIG